MSQRLKLRALGYPILLLGMSGWACGVDERALQPSTSGASGVGAQPNAGGDGDTPKGGDGATRSDGGTAGTGTGSEPSAGGDAAIPPTLPPLVDGCADLDTDGVADCSVTLVKNATFQSDISDWTEVGGSSLAWDARNALGDDPSGCALVAAEGAADIDGAALFRASQCVPVAEGQLLIAYANAWVEDSEVDDAAQAELQVSYFQAEDCSGMATGYFVTPPSTVEGAWVTVQAGGVTGAGTRSALVELIGIKPNRAEKLSACFDNVMLKAKTL